MYSLSKQHVNDLVAAIELSFTLFIVEQFNLLNCEVFYMLVIYFVCQTLICNMTSICLIKKKQ